MNIVYNNSVCVAVEENWPMFFHFGTERFSCVNNITRNLAQLNEIVAIIIIILPTSFALTHWETRLGDVCPRANGTHLNRGCKKSRQDANQYLHRFASSSSPSSSSSSRRPSQCNQLSVSRCGTRRNGQFIAFRPRARDIIIII